MFRASSTVQVLEFSFYLVILHIHLSLGRWRQQRGAAGDGGKLPPPHGNSCAPPLRLLEAQLQTQSRQHKDELEALHTQIELLRDDIEKKQELLNYTAALSPEAKVEYSVQQEITRLTNDNLVRNSFHPNGRNFRFVVLISVFSFISHAIIMHGGSDILHNFVDCRGWAKISLNFICYYGLQSLLFFLLGKYIFSPFFSWFDCRFKYCALYFQWN